MMKTGTTPAYVWSLRGSLAIAVAVYALAFVPLPGKSVKSAMRSIRSVDLNRADRDAHAAGYYVGLIDGGPDAGRDELTLRLLGKTSDWLSFHEVGATRYLPGDFLQFELKPKLDKPVFGKRFTTNEHGLRDRSYPLKKPEGTYRIALLGSSIDMGWGVGTGETYENLLEDWLNAHARHRGLDRRFEVQNFAMAAYSPLHRLESYHRKARAYGPDMVIYSATMLDTRLLEIHVRNLLQESIDLRYDFLRNAVEGAKFAPKDLRLDAFGDLRDKELVKAKLRPLLWPIVESTLGDLAARCRSEGVPLAMVLIPRASEADGPSARGVAVTTFTEIAGRLAIPVIDVTPTFDRCDPSSIEIAPWDDHPNARGHQLLFRSLARGVVDDPALYRSIFGAWPP